MQCWNSDAITISWENTCIQLNLFYALIKYDMTTGDFTFIMAGVYVLLKELESV